MEPRGQGWHEQGPQYPRSSRRDREESYRSHHSGQQGHYPSPDTREWDRRWYTSDPHYMHYMNGLPPAPEFDPAYSSQGYAPKRTRPHSRLAYDYPHQDYRDDYNYYDPSYYRGHYGYPAGSDGSGWPVQSGWRTDGYQERTGASYTPQHGYELRRDSEQYDGTFTMKENKESLENRSGTRELTSLALNLLQAGEPGGLASSKTSGLSSSTYELSQYINGAEPSDAAPPPHSEPEVESKSVAPLKFCVPHVAVSFGPAGQLVRVAPALPSHGEPAQVEMHSLEVILSETHEQNDMRDFPGPLAREDLHKVDVITFALQMADLCLKDKTVLDVSSASLLWHLLVLLCRQNGRIVGSDIAELLVRGNRSVGVCDGDGEQLGVESLIDLSETSTPETESLNASDLLTGKPLTNEETSKQNIDNYTKLLLAGRKKEALESAMQSGLWGHALFLASKMDRRASSSVLSRFTGSLSPSDPLQTLFQFLSGKVPAVSVSYSNEKWGDWRSHLAVMLSNETGDSENHCKSIVTLGDTLASRGLLHAAHICYLTAHTPFSWYNNKTHRLVLLGSSHSASFAKFCLNSSIRCTEVFEYCQRLADPSFIIPSFQVYKFLYACRLLDCGLISQAFHYCELVAKALLIIDEPHMVLLQEVIKLVDRLKHSETQLSETSADPDWLVLLRQRLHDQQMENSGSSGVYQIATEGNVWDKEENRDHPAPDPGVMSGDLPTTEMMHTSRPEDNLRSEESQYYQPHSSHASNEQSYIPNQTDPSSTSYPQQGPSYTSYPSEQQPFPPVTQRHTSEEHQTKMYAPVPMYSLQNISAPSPDAVQSTVYNPDASYQQNAASPDQRSRSNTDVGFSAGTNMMDAYENGSALGGVDLDTTTTSEAETKETTSQKSEETKSGWFSGWFRSKPKETPQENPQTKSVHKESPFVSAFPTTPMVSPAMPPSQPTAAGVNPFSRKAGQKLPGGNMGQNITYMSQGP
ncbi:protein transport protein Sec16B [Trichomycterus rosablanca]|uniref:protein transport protein Sec16B n=1 Tax=Trichomycterus rosablanca TaxID=2290929 RepID=UPI002F353004